MLEYSTMTVVIFRYLHLFLDVFITNSIAFNIITFVTNGAFYFLSYLMCVYFP